MKHIIEVLPLVGIAWGVKRINLSDPKDKIKEVLGKPDSDRKNSSFYFNSELRIDFNKNRCVEFIEFLSGIDGAIQPHIYGVDAFAVDAEILIGILREKNAGMVDDSEMGYCYNFMDISVGVYRESTPESVLEMMKEVGEDLTSEDLEIELKKANHWDTLGIGVKGYYL